MVYWRGEILQGDAMRWGVLLFALLLGGCATGYGKSSIFGGYWSKDGPGELIEIGFNGNGYTEADKVQVYLLYRSAEFAWDRGKAYFEIYPSIFDAISGRPIAETTANVLGGKPFGKVYMLTNDAQVEGALKTDDILARYADAVKGHTNGTAADNQGARR
jgi:hypothetical protein